MARFAFNVLLFALVTASGFAQSGSVTATAQGGFRYIGFEGEAAGSISGDLRLGKESRVDFMLVLKDVGGATKDGQNEAIIFMTSVESFKSSNGALTVIGKGTYQGESRTVELTLIDSNSKRVKDQFKVRVLKGAMVLFEKSEKVDPASIVIKRQR
jgi:hypothetical protein